jgi:hypothetical protein
VGRVVCGCGFALGEFLGDAPGDRYHWEESTSGAPTGDQDWTHHPSIHRDAGTARDGRVSRASIVDSYATVFHRPGGKACDRGPEQVGGGHQKKEILIE